MPSYGRFELVYDPSLIFFLGDAEHVCPELPAKGFALIHTDLPFNTQTTQKGRAGAYRDVFADYESWLRTQVMLYKPLLADNGLLALQLDEREHRTLLRVCDEVMGAENYRGTIIWHYETGGVAKQWWSMKHQYIVLYASGRGEPIFNADAVPTTERRSAPKRVTNARGESVVYDGAKRLSSVWNINMSTTDPQRCGYPNQKPLTLAQTLIAVHTQPLDWVLDPCCGSGTTGLAARALGRNAALVDNNPQALEAVRGRLGL